MMRLRREGPVYLHSFGFVQVLRDIVSATSLSAAYIRVSLCLLKDDEGRQLVRTS